MAQTKISDIISNSLESIRSVVDANTIIGTPIDTAGGTVIIPVSKISVGFASGGVDFQSKIKEDSNFGGGGGTGLTVTPVAFLAIKADGSVEMIPVASPSEGSDVAAIMDKVPTLIEKIKALFKKHKKDSDSTDDDDDSLQQDADDRVIVTDEEISFE